MQRAIWLGGFAIGALLGTAIFALSPDKTERTTADAATQITTVTTPAASGQVQLQQTSRPLSTFEQMVQQTVASQGGISLVEIAAIVRATRSLPDTPSYEELVRRFSASHGGRISIADMMALKGEIYQPNYSAPSAPLPSIIPSFQALSPYADTRGPATRSADEDIARRHPMYGQMPGSGYGTAPSLGAIASIQAPASQGLIDTSSGQFMPSVAGGYTDPRTGAFYAQAGPNGIVDTSTGQFIPTR